MAESNKKQTTQPNTTPPPQEVVKGSTDGRPVNYGLGTPSIPFEQTIQYLEAVAKNGLEGTFDVLSEAFDSTITSGYFKKKLQTEAKFSLLEYDIASKTYKITQIGRGIVNPISDQHKKFFLQKALLTHSVIKKIWDATLGNNVPQKIEFFANLIATKCSIPDELKTEWANYFLKAARYAELIRKRPSGDEYIISTIVEPSGLGGSDGGSEDPPPPPPPYVDPNRGQSFQPPNGGSALPQGDFAEQIRVPISNNRALYIFIPEGGLTENDIFRAKKKFESLINGGLESHQMDMIP